MFNERKWTVKCENCHKDMVYLKIYMETVNGTNELIMEHFNQCEHCYHLNNEF